MRLLLACTLFTFAPAFAADNDPWKLDDTFKALKEDDLKDAKSTPAPKGATVLFSGKDLGNWTKTNGKDEVKWTLRDGGVMEGVKGHGDIITKEKFGDAFKLHLEFRVPYEPGGAGQGRGNSGVYVQGRYEVQILDSYGLKSKNNDCGGRSAIIRSTGVHDDLHERRGSPEGSDLPRHGVADHVAESLMQSNCKTGC